MTIRIPKQIAKLFDSVRDTQRAEERNTANIDYIAMMSDIELEEETYESEISEG